MAAGSASAITPAITMTQSLTASPHRSRPAQHESLASGWAFFVWETVLVYPFHYLTQCYISGVASHFGFVSLPHFLGSSLCIFSIAFAVSGCVSMTCFVMALTISSHDAADSFCSQGPPNDWHVIVFMRHLDAIYRCTVRVEGLLT